MAASVGELRGRVALRPQDLRIGRNFADKQAALAYPRAGMINHRMAKII